MNSFGNAVDLFPSFVGTISPNNGSLEWNGACFGGNEVRMEFTQGNDGGKTADAHSYTCMDVYVFATPYSIMWSFYFISKEHKFLFESSEEPAELDYVKQHGVSVFLMPSGMLGTLLSLVDVAPLFSNTKFGQDANLAFLKNHMGATFETRSKPWRATIDPDEVHSGDFLAVEEIPFQVQPKAFVIGVNRVYNPENDEWVYSDGKSTTCVAFILQMYKAVGVFGSVADSVQVTEFTILDMLKIFENNQTRLPKWCNNGDDKLPFCQILGKYRMELPLYNTLEPYSNMNENCPSLPPTYERPTHC
ncbi:hypothetical protein L1987_38671 [Smallanthus sonchifolius]|uniref:Uncharacterized protein n=1 Tax=Smallanthus sonchifolius TaxID=185202 RepID=A0ACB9HLN5_9ASTR|nr:hypothetical protein L1987_38671 [Smallanthus sonchifolius]